MRAPDVEIKLDALPPSKNQWQGLHWVEQSKLFGRWHDLVWHTWLIARTQGKSWLRGNSWPRLKGPVDLEVTFTFPDKRRRDSRNYDCFPPLVDILTPEKVTLPSRGCPRGRVKPGFSIIEDDCAAILHWLPTQVVYGGEPQTVIRLWRREASDEKAG